jgi:hypothetical protein
MNSRLRLVYFGERSLLSRRTAVSFLVDMYKVSFYTRPEKNSYLLDSLMHCLLFDSHICYIWVNTHS